jgi:hypothetical protein
LSSFLDSNPDPDILVMGNSLWSLFFKPDQTMALQEYYSGLKKIVSVSFCQVYKKIFLILSSITPDVKATEKGDH